MNNRDLILEKNGWQVEEFYSHPLPQAALIVEKVMETTKRPPQDFLRLITLVCRGVNPFTRAEVELIGFKDEDLQIVLKNLQK